MSASSHEGRSAYNERISLPSENLDGVDGIRFVIDPIDLDYGHVVAVDGESIVRITGKTD